MSFTKCNGEHQRIVEKPQFVDFDIDLFSNYKTVLYTKGKINIAHSIEIDYDGSCKHRAFWRFCITIGPTIIISNL